MKFSSREGSTRDAAARWLARRDAGWQPGESQAFESWLAADPIHREAVGRLEAAWNALDRPFAAGASADFLREVQSRHIVRRNRRLLATAAVLAIGIGGWSVGDRSLRHSPPPLTQSGNEAIVHQPRRELLPDGSLVEVRGGAQIAIQFSAEIRRVVLHRGEAHFKVTHDAARPFIVEAAGVSVRAVGTEFSVQLGVQQVAVLVTEGRVAVAQEGEKHPVDPGQANASAPATVSTLDAGKLLVVERQGEAASPRVVEVSVDERDERLAWRVPRLEFTRTPLRDAVAMINEHGGQARGVRLVVAEPELQDLRVGGLFRADRTDAFIELLRSGFGIEAETRGTDILLRRAR
jgi:transmembrane sensor